MRMRFGMALTATLLLTAGACGKGDAVVVGSKNFTEQNIVSELVAQTLERRGIVVERRFHLGGTFVCHRALVDGGIDLYPEYTGTAHAAILERPAVRDAEVVMEAVRGAYENRWDLAWLSPLGFENTFALVIRRRDAERWGARSISDIVPIATELTAGFGPEFMARADGYDGLREAYGLSFGAIRQLDLGLMYRALEDREIDVAVANSTDGQIAALNLVVLEDDRRYFPPYEAAIVVRNALLTSRPEVRAAIESLSGTLDEVSMRELNRRVDVDGEDPRRVVRRWINEQEGGPGR